MTFPWCGYCAALAQNLFVPPPRYFDGIVHQISICKINQQSFAADSLNPRVENLLCLLIPKFTTKSQLDFVRARFVSLKIPCFSIEVLRSQVSPILPWIHSGRWWDSPSDRLPKQRWLYRVSIADSETSRSQFSYQTMCSRFSNLTSRGFFIMGYSCRLAGS